MHVFGKSPLSIVTGRQGEGKTTLLLRLIEFLKTKELKPGGIISRGNWINNKRDQIRAINLDTGEEILFCQRGFRKDWIRVGNFYVNPAYEAFSMKAVSAVKPDYFVLDEIGRFELQEKGWFMALKYLIGHPEKPLIISIRDSFIDEVIAKLGLIPEKIISVEQSKFTPIQEMIPESIISILNR